MRGVQLCSGSARYFCRLRGLNQGSTPSARDWPYPKSTTITMANGAVTSMVRNLAVELAPVRVNAIHPGAVGDIPAVTTRNDGGKPAQSGP